MTATTTVPGVDGDTWAVLCRTAAFLAQQSGSPVDPEEVLADPEGLRGVLEVLAGSAPLRAHLRAGGEHPLLADDDVLVQAAVQDVQQSRKAAKSAERKASRAQRRSPQEKAAARLAAQEARRQEILDRLRQRATEAEADLREAHARITELSEALRAESVRADTESAAAAAARAVLADPQELARHLLDRLTSTPKALADAALALPEQDREPATSTLLRLLGEIVHRTALHAHAQAQAMSVRMLGGGTHVGASCALVTAGRTRVLVDVGAMPGANPRGDGGPELLWDGLNGHAPDAIVLTHAHADHAGFVPAVLAAYPHVPVYATGPTAALLPTMWNDAHTVHTRRGGAAPFTSQDVHTAVAALRTVEHGNVIRLGQLTFETFPAGHILGAAGVLLSDEPRQVVISGDVSGPGQLTVDQWKPPAHAGGADLLVLESTYGATSTTQARARVVDELVHAIDMTISAGGRVLIPAFALGRAQELALICAERLPDVPVRIDGLARDITSLFEEHTGANGHPMRIWSDTIRAVPKGGTRAEAAAFTRGVVITTSGMLSAGPVLTWARTVLPDPASAMFIVGYQDPDSPGGALLAGLTDDFPHLTVAGDGPNGGLDIAVAANVRTFGLGAHAGADELVAIATDMHARATMLVHGDPPARAALAGRLATRHLPTVDPAETWRAAAALP